MINYESKVKIKIKRIVVGNLQTNCYILETKNYILIIDPGGNTKEILNEVKKKGQEVIIINTHYHFDHNLGNNELQKNLDAKIWIHEDERPYIDFKVDKFLKDGETFEFDEIKLKIIQTPGHTKGSVCLFEKTFVFTGDTLFKNGYGRTDFPGGDSFEMENSLKKLSTLIKSGATVYPGHGEPFIWKNMLE